MYNRHVNVLMHLCVQMLFSVAPGQQLFYYGARAWPDDVRKKMYEQFGGSPKDLLPVHDYDPKVVIVFVWNGRAFSMSDTCHELICVLPVILLSLIFLLIICRIVFCYTG